MLHLAAICWLSLLFTMTIWAVRGTYGLWRSLGLLAWSVLTVIGALFEIVPQEDGMASIALGVGLVGLLTGLRVSAYALKLWTEDRLG